MLIPQEVKSGTGNLRKEKTPFPNTGVLMIEKLDTNPDKNDNFNKCLAQRSPYRFCEYTFLRRVGLPMCTSHRCRCGAIIEPSRCHGLVCRQSGEREQQPPQRTAKRPNTGAWVEIITSSLSSRHSDISDDTRAGVFLRQNVSLAVQRKGTLHPSIRPLHRDGN
ncbi:hypothetical protein ACOME3_003349 [Neoechinorhynchus agilis]